MKDNTPLPVDAKTPDEIKKRDEERRMELTEHLGELRSRLMRIALYVCAGACVCYLFFQRIYAFLFFPMQAVMDAHKAQGWSITFRTFTQPFFVVLKISMVAGLILTAPFILGELWGFISPALTKEEKRPLRFIAPLSIGLFAAGVALAYWVAKFAIRWFVSYVDWFPHGVLLQDPETYVMFMLKMMGVFGAVFQLPIFLMFLAWIGLLRSSGMKKSWRTAVLLITVVGVFVTPSNDVFTMLVMIIPVVFLYIGSIWLVQLIERKKYGVS